MAANAIPPVRSKPKRSLATWMLWIGIGGMVVLFLFIVVMLFGKVSGQEFSPGTFTRRSFHYYELPVVGLQIWPITHFDSTGPLELDLVSKKLVPLPSPPVERWDFVRGFRASQMDREGDAYILCRYLDLRDKANAQVWLDWTSDHPELAKILWPAIAKLADQELYVFLPETFDLALSAKDAASFQPALNELLARKYYDFAVAQQKLGHHAGAVELINEALKLSPDGHDDWKATLTTSQQALPKAEAEQ